ncbi:MAG: host attachment family protein [Hyphomonadaceae bacterium]
MDVRNGDWVMVADGRKALFLLNDGEADLPVYKTFRILEQDNPATHEQGAERPGRAFSSSDARRSAYEQTDWHELEETRFASTIADALYKAAHDNRFKRIFIVAPPKALGDLRKVLHTEVSQRIVAEINKDLTNMPLYEIEKALSSEG